jgi:hypothetical protein
MWNTSLPTIVAAVSEDFASPSGCVMSLGGLSIAAVMNPYVFSRKPIMKRMIHTTPTARIEPVESRMKNVKTTVVLRSTAKATAGSIPYSFRR